MNCAICGKSVLSKNAFHINDKTFCSMDCVKPERERIIQEAAKKRKEKEYTYSPSYDGEGGSAF